MTDFAIVSSPYRTGVATVAIGCHPTGALMCAPLPFGSGAQNAPIPSDEKVAKDKISIVTNGTNRKVYWMAKKKQIGRGE